MPIGTDRQSRERQRPDPAALLRKHRWVSAALVAVLAVLVLLQLRRSEGLDFRAFYIAAKAAAAHLDPYTDNRLLGEQYVDVSNGNGISRWIYPPPALFFVAPLRIFTFPAARLLFGCCSIIGLIWVLAFFGRRLGVSPISIFLVGVSIPVIACVQRGQVDLFILFCVVLAYRFSARSWAGIPLGVAIAIKIFPGALLLWWVLERRFKQVAVTVAFTILIGVLAAWRFGVSSYASFLHNLTTLHASASSALGPGLSYSPGFVGSYNNPLVLLGNTGIIVGFVLAVAAVIALRVRGVPSEVGFFSTVLISQLMNTALWTMGLVMYIPICLIAIGTLRSRLAAVTLLLPLYIPSQLRIFGITPRLVFALLIVGWLINKKEFSTDFLATQRAYN